MKILPIHTEALRYFGYTEEESRFLYLVATHSGYFTCQQFLQFIKMKPGKRSVAFARKVVEKGHASSKEYLRHGRVFHLFSRNLYEAIGRENVRFRRAHSTEYIRTRLIALDFILRGRAALSKPRSRGNYAEVVGLFERASALDPRSVEAQSWLAIALIRRVLKWPTRQRATLPARKG